MTADQHLAEVNRLLQLPTATAVAGWCLGYSWAALASGFDVTQEQMRLLSQAKNVQHGMSLARQFWGDETIVEGAAVARIRVPKR